MTVDIAYIVDARLVKFLRGRRATQRPAALHWNESDGFHYNLHSSASVWPHNDNDCIQLVSSDDAFSVWKMAQGNDWHAAKRIRERIVAVMPDTFRDSMPVSAQARPAERRYNPYARKEGSRAHSRSDRRNDGGRAQPDSRSTAQPGTQAGRPINDHPPY